MKTKKSQKKTKIKINLWPFKAACKSVCFFAAAVLLCLRVSAAVYTSADDSGDAQTVYVAGNPDCFPLEYYRREEKTFRGAIPDMLKAVSEKTGVSFTYISASQENRQKELSRNNQVELVTALSVGGEECKVSEIFPILEVSDKGETEIYGIGFTEIASAELKEKLKSAFSEISEKEKMGLLLANAQRDPEIENKNRTIRIILISAAALFAAVGVFAAIVLHKTKRAKSDTMVDELTGVGNAKYYTYVFDQLLSRQSRNLYAVIYIAADNVKITAEHGEKAIPEIEKYAAARLNSQVASAEYLARAGGGIFVLLIQAPNESECVNRTQTIVNGLNRYIREFYPDTSNLFRAGISRLCDHPDCNAETAFYNAKQGYLATGRGGNSVSVTNGSSLAKSKKREKLRRAIAKAVANGEFRVYFQLITENKTGKFCGAEVLSRWQNPEYGVLRPNEYIELLKETGQIIVHDYKMFSAVCRQLEAWSAEPYNKLFVTCNFTRISLGQTDFFEHINEISSNFKFDHSRLVIEVTEDSITENSKVISENIRRCRETGFRIAIDDMGAGFSSFADLYDNDIDMVKISGEFIGQCTSERRRTMLSDIALLVHHSGAKILCEGVENSQQAEFLDNIGCDMMQGFYFSKILPSVECQKFLAPEKICEKPMYGNK